MDDNEELFHSLEAQIIGCQRCPRLVEWRQEVARVKRRAYLDWEYWGKPVPGFGDYRARVLVVGLAPGAHGANRTGRMFTGDGSGDFLYPALHRAGFASQSHADKRGDGLKLEHMFISAVCRCVPPGNKPKAGEISNCLPYLEREIDLLDPLEVIVALGRISPRMSSTRSSVRLGKGRVVTMTSTFSRAASRRAHSLSISACCRLMNCPVSRKARYRVSNTFPGAVRDIIRIICGPKASTA